MLVLDTREGCTWGKLRRKDVPLDYRENQNGDHFDSNISK